MMNEEVKNIYKSISHREREREREILRDVTTKRNRASFLLTDTHSQTKKRM